MSTTQLKIVFVGLFFLFMFLFGFWLSRNGKPYNMALFTMHKLIALGAVVYLVLTIAKIHQATPLTPIQFTAVIITALCFVVTAATGAMLSVDKVMPEIVHRMHQITPYLTVLSTGATLYLLLIASKNLIKI